MPGKANPSLAETSTSAARERPDLLADLARHLGIDHDAVERWLEPVHGRTKLANAFGRLWPADPDVFRPRPPFSEDLAAARNSDARHDPALVLELARHLGAAPPHVEADLYAEHHRMRIDSCRFDACESAYRDALARRGAALVATPSAPVREPTSSPPAPSGKPKRSPPPAAPASTASTASTAPTTKIPPEIAALRVSDARTDDRVLFKLADALDQSPGMIRAALARAHHRQRLDTVDFAPAGPSQELLLARPAAEAPPLVDDPFEAPEAPLPAAAAHATDDPFDPPEAPALTARDGDLTHYDTARRPSPASALTLPSALPQRPSADPRALPKPGQIARCRHRNWLVEAIHPPREDRRNAAHLVDLVCLDDDAPGRELSVLWELELGAYLTEPEAGQLRGLDAFDPPEHFAAYLNTLRWNATTAADQTLFQAPLRAGIHVQPYQLAPLMKALELPRANLFIADDVGLGKTVEAGLVLQELLLRQRVDFVLVVAPASVCLQWKEELYKRFGLHFQVYDRAFVAETRQQRGYKVNPWTTQKRFIISYPLLRRAEHLEPLRAFLSEHREHGKRRKSLLILDEAHTVAPSSGTSYAVDSQITRIAREHLCPRFENRLFLSATPHNGHSNSFSALLELLDPQRFHRATPVSKSADSLRAVMIRRLKRDIRRVARGLFPRREVIALTLRHQSGAWTAEAALHAPRPDLPGYTRPALPLAAPWTLPAGEAPALALARLLHDYELAVAPANKRQRLVFANLQKRLLSSIAAFYRTLCAHARRFDADFAGRLDALAAHTPPAPDAAPDAPDALDEDDLDRPDEALEAEELARTAAATASLGKPSERARALLGDMLDLARRHAGTPDGRVHALLEWIRRNQCPAVHLGDPAPPADRRWGPRKLILFTEYTDTKSWLRRLLLRAFEGTDRGDERLLEIHGAIGDDKREEIQRAFNAPPADHPVRILLATDAAREGINLQGACADLIHFDIPWNPARMEQRSGRIDRTLQPEPEARTHYFVYAQRDADIVLDAVVRKVDVIREELGSVGNVVMGQIAELLEGQSLGPATAAALEAAATPAARQRVVQAELDAAQADADKRLDAEIRRAGTRYSDAVKKLGFDPRLLHRALDVALALLGAPPLAPVAGDGGVQAYQVPPLPPGWESTLDALRRPRERDESLWEWRRAAPPQPVVFDPPPQMTSPRVHLHLHHPLVRRLLDLFTSIGFSAHQLQHLTLVQQGHDGHAYAVAIARVSLFGSGAVRLHDELVEHIVRIGGDTADGPLEPLKERDVGQLSSVLAANLAAERHPPLPPARSLRPLLARARRDFAALWPALRARGQEAAEEAGKRLHARGEVESRQLRELLLAQRAQLQEQLPLVETSSDTERRQRQADEDARRDRLAAIDREIQEEPADLKALYKIQLSRIEPVGLVYLWPRVWE